MARFVPIRACIAAVLLIICLIPARPGYTGSSAIALPSPQALDSLLTSTLRPPRDLNAITARLKLHTTTPIDPFIRNTPVNYPVGSTARFYVSECSSGCMKLLPATLVLKTTHAYYYVQNGMPVNRQALARSAATFERHSYPTDHALFGQEWTPGIDDDQHITIFNGKLDPSDLGYFSQSDMYPRVVDPYSNQRKMIFLSLTYLKPGTSAYDSTLAHEFQHMIHFHLHPADEAWINEGDSVLAQVLNGYTDSGYASAKASQPATQLDSWDPNNFSPYYGGGLLWMLYLYEHYGGARLTRAELADSTRSNMAVFDDVLAKLGYHKSAEAVFADWVVANFVNDRSIFGGRYGYSHTGVRAQADAAEAGQFSRQGTLPQYSASYTDVTPAAGKALTLRFSGQPEVSLLSTVTPVQGVWWSNRGDSVDTTLDTPVLDLRGVQQATLRYQIWYDLETNYDYGYVEVSTDGGQTWYGQRTAHTTDADPNGANLGNGYTGTSCTAASKGQGCWLSEQVDLRRYVGKQILVRFEQVTDDAYNRQGIAIAHVQVPEIGFTGDSTAAGWQAAGWVRTGNEEAEHWIVQAIVYRANRVSAVLRLPVGSDGQGRLTIPAGASRVVAVVSPTAPLTTVTSHFTLSGGS